ncbi:hypothetical protein GQ600_22757 [Phytophthora cactorum]|nr:hypothetical protein GQ600_22757 [Phytophthora cactorum]
MSKNARYYEVLGDLIHSRRVVIPPSVFFDVLEANNVVFGRSDARLLLSQFQEPNGAVVATKFLRWIALNAPADHMDPDLQFAQLPQPHRRIKKILDYDIFDGAWETIKLESTRYKSESASEGAINSSRSSRSESNHNQLICNDYHVAKSRSCEPSWRFPLENDDQKVVGLASHCLVPIVVAAISSGTAPTLRIVSTSDEDAKVFGDFPTTFPLDPVAAGTADSITKTHVSVKQLSALQLASDGSCSLAVHLVETTSTELVNADPSADVQPPTSTTRECVNIYAIRTADNTEISCRLVAVIRPPQRSAEFSTSSIVFRPGANSLALFGDRVWAYRSFPEAPRPSRLQTRVVSNSSPELLAPVKSWEHLTRIITSAQDLTTQYVAVRCQDGSIVVWDVLRDVDYAFLLSCQDSDKL